MSTLDCGGLFSEILLKIGYFSNWNAKWNTSGSMIRLVTSFHERWRNYLSINCFHLNSVTNSRRLQNRHFDQDKNIFQDECNEFLSIALLLLSIYERTIVLTQCTSMKIFSFKFLSTNRWSTNQMVRQEMQPI